jgi:uncharacterized protein YjbI with pentapeptide repeats
MDTKQVLESHATWLRTGGVDGERANLRWANLSGADLSVANLSRADLSGADLSGADLRGADLSGADLSGADLRGADLRRADLSGADLSGADLRRADLSGADLSRADLRGADLSRADLSGAKGLPGAPVIPNLHRRMAEVCAQPDALNMSTWHTCATTHCRAGWAIHMAGEAGAVLERAHGPCAAGALIYQASTGTVPDFNASNEAALEDIKRLAAL